MKIQHAPPEAFHRMIAGNASRDESKAIVRHLLAGCGPCIERSRAAQKQIETPDTWDYDRAFARLEARMEAFNEGVPAPEERQPARRACAGLRR